MSPVKYRRSRPLGRLNDLTPAEVDDNFQALEDAVAALDQGKAAAVHVHPLGAVGGLTEALAAKADLIGGKIADAQLPPLAITDVFPVLDQAAMLALSAQRGDVASYVVPGETPDTFYRLHFILQTEPASVLANWHPLDPTLEGVTSFNGRMGVVVPLTGDYRVDQIAGLPEALAAAGNAPRTLVRAETAILAPGATATLQAPLGKAYEVLQVATSGPARVRAYTTDAFRAADAARPSSQDPAAPSGLVLDLVTAAGSLTWPAEPPFPTGGNLETPPTADAFLSITNLATAPQPVAVEFLIFAKER